MNKLAIIHFQPLEQYPPVENLINYIGNRKFGFEVQVFSTIPVSSGPTFCNAAVVLCRYGKLDEHKNKLQRLFQYLLFYYRVFFQLLKYRPSELLYFESLSFLPVYGYLLFAWVSGRKPRIFCHYHEYTSPAEYINGMFLNRVSHALEKKYYAGMVWISHTNEDRMNFFKEDHPALHFRNTYILPNYPPGSWLTLNRPNENRFPIRIVYVGAVGMDTMYIKEFAQWVERKNGSVTWDIYSQQDAGHVVQYLSSISSRYIHFKGQVNYYDLPQVLKNYNVGVILYKGHIPNYIYNAPNKLFEYYACGLDSWFPVEMKSSWAYINTGVYPKIIPVDFKTLDNFDADAAIDRLGLVHQYSPYFCEKVLDVLWKEIRNTAI